MRLSFAGFLMALFGFSSAADAQSIPLNYFTGKCGTSTAGQIYMLFTGPTSYPLCMAKGLSLKVTVVNGQATLDVDDSKVLQAVPKIAKERIAFDPNTPATTTTIRYMLPKTPTADSQMIMILKSSRLPGDVVDAITPTGPNLKELVIRLPEHRPLTEADSLVVVYWTRE